MTFKTNYQNNKQLTRGKNKNTLFNLEMLKVTFNSIHSLIQTNMNNELK